MKDMELPELDTRTVLDIVNDNYANAGIKSVMCRIVYAGDQLLGKQKMPAVFRQTVDAVNEIYCDVHVSGLLLIYDAYFIHILEGSEDTIHRQLRYLQRAADDYESSLPTPPPEPDASEDDELKVLLEEQDRSRRVMFKRLKMLMIYHCIKERTISDWGYVAATPPILLGKFDPYRPVEYHMEQLKTCLDKIKDLIKLYNENQELSFEGLKGSDKKMQVIPEYVLLEFLFESKFVLDIKEYMNYHRKVMDFYFYRDKVWPLSTHFTPRFLYKLKVDEEFVEPLPLQEWQKKAPELEVEGEEERRKSSNEESD